MQETGYESPFSGRYAGKDMQYLFSAEKKFTTWRRLWVALAEAESELGLPITREQLQELRDQAGNINYEVAAAREKEVRHDVMAHVYAYGKQCPKAKGIIHLGATSCFVGDNTDLIIFKEALLLLQGKLLGLIRSLSEFARTYKALPTLGFTHFQAAQPTTVGKRATLWISDFLSDYRDMAYVLGGLRLRGAKGTTGTQASFLELFSGNEEKVYALDEKIAEKMGFPGVYPVTSQTYSRKVDQKILSVLAGLATSAAKFSTDIRLLQHLKEVEEPFEKQQIGSSAMAYKRNPMRSERIAALSRYLLSDALNPAMTAQTQWLERSLDDSANRRISMAEGFLAADAVLNLCANVASGLVVYPKVIEKHLNEELPFMATETILMDGVKAGADRQTLHEKIRRASMLAAKHVREEGKENDLLYLLARDPEFPFSEKELADFMHPSRYIGLAEKQTERFLEREVKPLLAENKDKIAESAPIEV